MTSAIETDRLRWLREAAESGEVHTVRVAWVDRLGTIRGKRFPVELFLGSPDRRVGFCDGMIVVDVNCDVIQETPFSNFETGYPDMYLSPRLETLQRIGWGQGEALVFGSLEDHGGQPLDVAPSNVLTRVVERLRESSISAAVRLTVAGRLMQGRGQPLRLLPDGLGVGEGEPGILRLALEGLNNGEVDVQTLESDRQGGFRLGLGWADPLLAAERAALIKSAMKELGRTRGVEAVFMTRLPRISEPSCLEISLSLKGVKVRVEDLERRLSIIRALFQPSINAFKAGSLASPVVTENDEGLLIEGIYASSEADPVTALMGVLSAVGAGADGTETEPAGEVGLREATGRLDDSDWAREWLGDIYIDNTVALLRHENSLFEESVTDWELNRYWSAA